jgi:hypothetical protein
MAWELCFTVVVAQMKSERTLPIWLPNFAVCSAVSPRP